jgi:hypothetical protein
METIDVQELTKAIQDLGITLSRAKAFVDEGKEVYCSNKLQGALVKCDNILRYVNSFNEDAEESQEDTQEDQDEVVVEQDSNQERSPDQCARAG